MKLSLVLSGSLRRLRIIPLNIIEPLNGFKWIKMDDHNATTQSQ